MTSENQNIHKTDACGKQFGPLDPGNPELFAESVFETIIAVAKEFYGLKENSVVPPWINRVKWVYQGHPEPEDPPLLFGVLMKLYGKKHERDVELVLKQMELFENDQKERRLQNQTQSEASLIHPIPAIKGRSGPWDRFPSTARSASTSTIRKPRIASETPTVFIRSSQHSLLNLKGAKLPFSRSGTPQGFPGSGKSTVSASKTRGTPGPGTVKSSPAGSVRGKTPKKIKVVSSPVCKRTLQAHGHGQKRAALKAPVLLSKTMESKPQVNASQPGPSSSNLTVRRTPALNPTIPPKPASDPVVFKTCKVASVVGPSPTVSQAIGTASTASASQGAAAGLPSSAGEVPSKPSAEKEEGQEDEKPPRRPLSSHIFFKACEKAQPKYDEMKAAFVKHVLVYSEGDFDKLVKNKGLTRDEKIELEFFYERGLTRLALHAGLIDLKKVAPEVPKAGNVQPVPQAVTRSLKKLGKMSRGIPTGPAPSDFASVFLEIAKHLAPEDEDFKETASKAMSGQLPAENLSKEAKDLLDKFAALPIELKEHLMKTCKEAAAVPKVGVSGLKEKTFDCNLSFLP